MPPEDVMELAGRVSGRETGPSPHLREDVAGDLILAYYEPGSNLAGRPPAYVTGAWKRLARERTFRDSVERAETARGLSIYGPTAVAVGILERFLGRGRLTAAEQQALDAARDRLGPQARSGWDLCVERRLPVDEAAREAGVGAEAMRKRRTRALRYVLDGLTVAAPQIQSRTAAPRVAPRPPAEPPAADLETAPPDADLVRLWLREAGSHKLLTAAEEVELAKAVEAGRDAAARLAAGRVRSERTIAKLEALAAGGEAAFERFVAANLRLVVSVARRHQHPGLTLLDLVQEGNIGLLRAVERFDWRRGFKFSTYATWWIRQAITRAVADNGRTIRLPVHVHETATAVSRASEALFQRLGRDPSPEEIAAEAALPVSKVQEILRLPSAALILDRPVGEDGDTTIGDMLPDAAVPDPFDELEKQFLAEDVRRTIRETLSDRERRVLELRYGLHDGRERTLEQVGVEFSLTRERVRQIEGKALTKLRHPVAPNRLLEYA